MISILNLKEGYNLPQKFLDLLPEYCEFCGSTMEINETLTGLRCSNPKCSEKVVYRIKAMLKDLGVIGLGSELIAKFVDYHEITNHLDILDLQEGDILSPEISTKISDKVIKQLQQHKQFKLWEFVQLANLPYIQTSAKKIFEDYDNLYDAFEDIHSGGFNFIKEKLGIKAEGINIQSIKIYNVLIEYENELREGVEYVDIIPNNVGSEITLVASDQVGDGFGTKKEFYNYIKDEFGNKYSFNIVTSVTKKIDFLIWAGADGSPARYTSKVQKAQSYIEKGENIKIMTASQFIDYLMN